MCRWSRERREPAAARRARIRRHRLGAHRMSLSEAWHELRRTKLMLRASAEFALEEVMPLTVDIYVRKMNGGSKEHFISIMEMAWDIYHENSGRQMPS
jgi:hypothetical protein